ncbi:MAG TPA: replication-relaxation family protein [Candidatus Saccharimonadia bacterium]|nr:replication-relaxation family protein [Candidatus Saccharimonadia bacterium]
MIKTPTTKQQLAILTLIYRFRFVSTKHIQQALGIKYLSSVQPRLNRLVELGLIGRNYNGSLRLAGLPASYYLQPKGMHALKAIDSDVSKAALHNAYKDKTASEQFIQHCLAIADVSHELTECFGVRVEFFTKSESKEYDYFPQPLPDGYLTIAGASTKDDDSNQYFLEVCDKPTPMFAHKKRIQELIDYAEGGEWEAATGTEMPTILFVCESPDIQRKLMKLIEIALEDSYEDELKVEAILKSQICAILDPKKSPEATKAAPGPPLANPRQPISPT